jgi:hypothetical protein
LILCENDRWRIAGKTEGGRTESAYATEIISLWGSRLYVGGDIDDCVFAYSDNSDSVAKLRWIGKCNDVGYYVCQKAQIGMTDNGKLTLEGRGRNRGPSARVIYAWAAVRRLCELFDETRVERELKQTEIERVIQKERWALTPESYLPEDVCPFCHGVDCDCRIEDFEGELPGSR